MTWHAHLVCRHLAHCGETTAPGDNLLCMICLVPKVVLRVCGRSK